MSTVTLALQAHPGARRARVHLRGGSVHVYVIAPPEGGKANEELVAVLAGALGIARSRIAIVRGHTSRSKVVVVEGLSESAVAAALAQPPDR